MILLKDCFRVLARCGAPRGEGAELSGVDILVDGGRIRRVGPGLAASERLPPGTRVIDASRHVVLPERWLDSRDLDAEQAQAVAQAELSVSGG